LQIRDGKSGAVRLMVSDTGPGIPKQNHRAAFKPYERLEQTYGTKSGGGVGLTIARSYVHAMHGEIGLEREPSDGTHVWIEVPAA
jgi:signal transduction histidine kinase